MPKFVIKGLILTALWIQSFSALGLDSRCDDLKAGTLKGLLELRYSATMIRLNLPRYEQYLALGCPALATLGLSRTTLEGALKYADNDVLRKILASVRNYRAFRNVSDAIEAGRRQLAANGFDLSSEYIQFLIDRAASAHTEELKKYTSAETCPSLPVKPITLVDSGPSMVERGWCYSNAAADIVSNQLGFRVSSIALALVMNSRSNRQASATEAADTEGGLVDAAISDARDGKLFCREVDIYDGTKLRIDGREMGTVDFLKSLANGTISSSDSAIQYLFPAFNSVGYSMTPKPMKMETLLRLICRPVEVDPGRPIEGRSVEFVQASLAQGKPVAASFDIQMYYYDQNLTPPKYDTTGHAATIVGQRFNQENSRCEYVIHDPNFMWSGLGILPEMSTGHVVVSRQALEKFKKEFHAYSRE